MAPDATPDPRIARARAWVADRRANFRSVFLATASASAEPEASVVAATLDARGAFLIHVSALAAHTRHLRENGRASVLLAEDEATTTQPLARRRLTWRCAAEFLPSNHPGWSEAVEALRARFGAAIELTLTLPDFHLVRVVPQSGRLVAGFGETYEADPADWTKLTAFTPPRRGA
jgi:putative heme iron utilization protein